MLITFFPPEELGFSYESIECDFPSVPRVGEWVHLDDPDGELEALLGVSMLVSRVVYYPGPIDERDTLEISVDLVPDTAQSSPPPALAACATPRDCPQDR
jgi:hypothetical protein